MEKNRRDKRRRLTRTCEVCGVCTVQRRGETPAVFLRRFMTEHTLKHWRQMPDLRHAYLLQRGALEVGVLPTGSYYVKPMS